MRTDPCKSESFKENEQWEGIDLELGVFRPINPDVPNDGYVARSFSGKERNRMFLQTEDNFDDVSLVSGTDARYDGRGFVLFDFDRDGWLDLGLTSPQSPRFRVLRNTLGDNDHSKNQFAYIGLEGGNRGTEEQNEWSSRDPYGAKVLVTIGSTKRMYQLSCGEGLSSQNSRWIHVGMGKAKAIDRIDVAWPSGKKTVYENVAAGSRVVLHEDGKMEE